MTDHIADWKTKGHQLRTVINQWLHEVRQLENCGKFLEMPETILVPQIDGVFKGNKRSTMLLFDVVVCLFLFTALCIKQVPKTFVRYIFIYMHVCVCVCIYIYSLCYLPHNLCWSCAEWYAMPPDTIQTAPPQSQWQSRTADCPPAHHSVTRSTHCSYRS